METAEEVRGERLGCAALVISSAELLAKLACGRAVQRLCHAARPPLPLGGQSSGVTL